MSLILEYHELSQQHRRLHSQLLAKLQPADITPQRAVLLSLLDSRKHYSCTDLAKKMDVTLPHVTALADGLVRSGYVRRAVHRQDRRSHTLTITAKGLSLLEEVQR